MATQHYRARELAEAISTLARMPPLRHSVDDGCDVSKSEVISWLKSQPSVMLWLLITCTSKGYIKFDRTTGLWSGNLDRLTAEERTALTSTHSTSIPEDD